MGNSKTRKEPPKKGVGRPKSDDPKLAITVRLRESTIKRAEKAQKRPIRKVIERDFEFMFGKDDV
jgi:hypothetical protein